MASGATGKNTGTVTGELLRVNLTTGMTSRETIPDEIIKDYVGGRGFGIKYLYDEVKPGTDPLGPENRLIFTVGPLAGTSAQSCARWFAITKSPLTGGYGRGSGGGDFGAWIKFAGLDFILVQGKAATPSYLYIEEGKQYILDAADLWGKDTEETQKILQAIHGDRCRIACIGPAAEKLVRYAVIATGRRTASRGGLGTVMGAKNLKAVVINVKRKINIAEPEKFKEVVKRQVKGIKENFMCQAMSREGTTSVITPLYLAGLIPVRNFREGRLEGAEKLSADAYTTMKTGQFGCYSCMIKCGQIHKVTSGPYAGAESEGPEYETLWSLGFNLGNTDIGSTVAADALCDLLGIDTMSMGGVIGLVMELYERGILTKDKADGLDLSWGNHEAIIELIKKTASRQGLGNLLAEGTKRVAESFGREAEPFAMHVKGLDFAAYEPRAAKGQGASYAVANIGAAHGYGISRQEFYGSPVPRPVDRFADTGKGDIVAWNHKGKALQETASVCSFIAPVIPPPMLAEFLSAATGIAEFGSIPYLDKVGERVVTLERCFNVREGFSRADDTLPARFQKEPLANAGPSTGQVIANLDALVDEYYSALGYDSHGIPTPERLAELGLDFAIDEMQSHSQKLKQQEK